MMAMKKYRAEYDQKEKTGLGGTNRHGGGEATGSSTEVKTRALVP